MATFMRLVWPGLRLMMLPFAWLTWFPAVAIMLAGTGLIMCTLMDNDAGARAEIEFSSSRRVSYVPISGAL